MRLRRASQQAIADLRAYAEAQGGRFLVFGSTARDDLKHDSDFDVIIDFPPGKGLEARLYTEELLRRHGLVPDVLLLSEASDGLLARVRHDALSLP